MDARITTRLAWLVIIPLCALAAVTAFLWLTLAAMANPKGRRAWELAEGFDRLANAAVGGESEMTISAHAGRDSHRRWAKVLCPILHLLDPDHCAKSIAAYRERHRS
jgi:hypothetical protein